MLLSRRLGTLPEALGDMPGVSVAGALHLLGGGSGEAVRDAIVRVDTQSGGCAVVGQLPYASRGHQAVVVEGAIYMLGGFDQGTRADVYRLDPKDWSSHKLQPMPSSNAWFAATTDGAKIYVIGGFMIPEGYLGQVYVYDVAADRWSTQEDAFETSPFTKKVLGGNAAVCHEKRLLSFGGADFFDPGLGRANALPHVCAYDPAARSWSPVSALETAREGLVAVKHGDTAYLVGGMSEAHDAPSALVEKVDLRTGAIEVIARLNVARLTPGVGIVSDRLIVAGGVTKPLFEMTNSIEYVALGGH